MTVLGQEARAQVPRDACGSQAPVSSTSLHVPGEGAGEGC